MTDMATITPQHTADHFIGANALTWGWWDVTESYGLDTVDSPDDWYVCVVEVREDGEAPGPVYRFDHAVILRAVNTLARTARAKAPEFMAADVLAECGRFIKNPDDADFDAGSADAVLQYAAFGKVIYG